MASGGAAGDPVPRLRLSRSMRVRAGGDFVRLKQRGRRLVKGCLVANWQEREPAFPSRVGVITSRKLGGAVIRNRARRLLRETFRRHQHDLRLPVSMVLVARNSIVGLGYADVERDFLTALRQGGLLKEST